MKIKEIWKDIAGYKGLYKVSNHGQVKRLKGNKYRIMKGAPSYGYTRVCLTNKGIKKHFAVHRLVAIAFIQNLENKPAVNHKDSNRANNHISNLEWVTCQENITHGRKYGNGAQLGEKHPQSKLKDADIPIIREMRHKNKMSLTKIAATFHVGIMTISTIINKKAWKHI